MKYSRSQINKAGNIIISNQGNVFEYNDAMTMIDEWRKLHLPVLEELTKEIDQLFAENHITPAFSSQRLKRMTSIREKLMRSDGMGLGGVQDIGGARCVFHNMEELTKAKECLSTSNLKSFTLSHAPYDYINTPKESGYRSIHYVYKYVSDNPDYHDMRVELQIRTKLQHDWATAVETAELISQSPLKASMGDPQWQKFFQIVSAIFALREGQAVNPMFAGYTEKDYCTNYSNLITQHKYIDQLKALVGVVNLTEKHSFNKGYALVYIDYNNKTINVRHFNSKDRDQANTQYASIESRIDKKDGAVVLVSVTDIQELREAYPSYFLNAKEFIDELQSFNNMCKIKGYV